MTDARELAQVARDRMGLKPALSEPKIEALLRAMPEGERRGYCLRLIASDAESSAWKAFAETLLVHETYFFRHPDQLRLLADVLLPQILEERIASGQREVRVWCAACSSGEEVYTLALLVQAAIARSALPNAHAWNVTILGTDLSAPTLDVARKGSYALAPGLNSFRDVPEFARHHFAAILNAAATTWSASAELRSMTRFVVHNLVAEPPALRDVDLVTCRNVLIYFDEAQTKAALTSLESALRTSGSLLLGPAETVSEPSALRMICAEQAVYWTKAGGR